VAAAFVEQDQRSVGRDREPLHPCRVMIGPLSSLAQAQQKGPPVWVDVATSDEWHVGNGGCSLTATPAKQFCGQEDVGRIPVCWDVRPGGRGLSKQSAL
jgi:hypothetical protein